MTRIATQVYGTCCEGIELSPMATEKLELFEKLGYGNLPICMAKTQYSLTHDPAIKGVPTEPYKIPVQDVRVFAGAGFVCALTGQVSRITYDCKIFITCFVDSDDAWTSHPARILRY